MLVVDASFGLQACLAPDGFRPVGRHLTAPSLWWSEVTSALHQLRWRATISAELAEGAFERLQSSAVDQRSPADLRSRAWRIATDMGWAKTYDAEYVALADLQGCPLLTIDERLRRGAARIITTLGPTEL